MTAIVTAGNLARRPVLDPADWKLRGLSVWHHNDLLEWRSPRRRSPRTSMEAELVPLTKAAVDMIPSLAGHQFFTQGRMFLVTWAQVNFEPDALVTVSIRCEELWGPEAQPPLLEQPQPLLP